MLFFWSEIRLVIAAMALFLGGVPPVWLVVKSPALFGIVSPLLTLCWIISGLAAVYLLYRWYQNKQVLFGGKALNDTVAFFVAVVSGVNLGMAGLIRQNIGMAISSNKAVFIVVGLFYLASAGFLYKRWTDSGNKIF